MDFNKIYFPAWFNKFSFHSYNFLSTLSSIYENSFILLFPILDGNPRYFFRLLACFTLSSFIIIFLIRLGVYLLNISFDLS